MMALIVRLPLVFQLSCPFAHHFKKSQWAAISNSRRNSRILGFSKAEMAADSEPSKVIDSHLHVWASPQEASENYPYFPGQEPTLPGHVEYLIELMEEAGVAGALIVQPINHKFDHSYVTSVLKKYPSKFIGCCLANPAEDGSGIKQLENFILKDGYRAVRFNPYLWPPGQPARVVCIFHLGFSAQKDVEFDKIEVKEGAYALRALYFDIRGQMTNEVGKAMFSKAGELGAPVGFMCTKGLNMHPEIEQLCEEFPSTIVLLDHVAFCKPPINDEEQQVFNELLKLSRFPQVYVKFSALFRVSRNPYPFEDLSDLLSKIVSSYGANRVMWGSDFPYVVPECGYKEAKEAVCQLAQQVNLSTSELEWIMGKTVKQIFDKQW